MKNNNVFDAASDPAREEYEGFSIDSSPENRRRSALNFPPVVEDIPNTTWKIHFKNIIDIKSQEYKHQVSSFYSINTDIVCMPQLDIGGKKPSPFWASLAKDILTPFAPSNASLIQKLIKKDTTLDETLTKSFLPEESSILSPKAQKTNKHSSLLKLTKIISSKHNANGNFSEYQNASINKNVEKSMQKSFNSKRKFSLTKIDSFRRKTHKKQQAKSSTPIKPTTPDIDLRSISFLSGSAPLTEMFEEENTIKPIQRKKSTFNLGKIVVKPEVVKKDKEDEFKLRRKSCHCTCCGKMSNLETRSMNLVFKTKMKLIQDKSVKASNEKVEVPIPKKNFAPRRSFQNDSLAMKFSLELERKMKAANNRNILSPLAPNELNSRVSPLIRIPSNNSLMTPNNQALPKSNAKQETTNKFFPISSVNELPVSQAEGSSQQHFLDPNSSSPPLLTRKQTTPSKSLIHIRPQDIISPPSNESIMGKNSFTNTKKTFPNPNEVSMDQVSDSQSSSKSSLQINKINFPLVKRENPKKLAISTKNDSKHEKMRKLLGNMKDLKNMEKKLRAKMKVLDESYLIHTNSARRQNHLAPVMLSDEKPSARSAYSIVPFHIMRTSFNYSSVEHRRIFNSGQGWINKPSKPNNHPSSNLISMNSTLSGPSLFKPYELSRKSSLQLK